jgi:hypothetical protein
LKELWLDLSYFTQGECQELRHLQGSNFQSDVILISHTLRVR